MASCRLRSFVSLFACLLLFLRCECGGFDQCICFEFLNHTHQREQLFLLPCNLFTLTCLFEFVLLRFTLANPRQTFLRRWILVDLLANGFELRLVPLKCSLSFKLTLKLEHLVLGLLNLLISPTYQFLVVVLILFAQIKLNFCLFQLQLYVFYFIKQVFDVVGHLSHGHIIHLVEHLVVHRWQVRRLVHYPVPKDLLLLAVHFLQVLCCWALVFLMGSGDFFYY